MLVAVEWSCLIGLLSAITFNAIMYAVMGRSCVTVWSKMFIHGGGFFCLFFLAQHVTINLCAASIKINRAYVKSSLVVRGMIRTATE